MCLHPIVITTVVRSIAAVRTLRYRSLPNFLDDPPVRVLDGLGAVNPMEQTALLVMLQDGRHVPREDLQTPWRRLCPIVGSSAELTALEEASDQLILGHLEKDRGADRAPAVGQPRVQRLSLCEIAREAIEDRSSLGIRLRKTGEDKL